MSKYHTRGKTALERLAPAVALSLDELQDAIANLGEAVGVALAAQKQKAEQQKPVPAPVRERLTTEELIIEEASLTKCHRAREVARRLDIHQQTLWRWIREDRFPRGTKIGPMRTVWSEATIAQWLAEQAAKDRP